MMWRLGILAAAVLALIGGAGVSYRMGQTSARAECQAAAIQAELDVAHSDLRAARRAAADAEQRAAALDTTARQNTEKVDALERELSERDAALDATPEPAPAPVDGKCPTPRRSTSDRLDSDGLKRLRGGSR